MIDYLLTLSHLVVPPIFFLGIDKLLAMSRVMSLRRRRRIMQLKNPNIPYANHIEEFIASLNNPFRAEEYAVHLYQFFETIYIKDATQITYDQIQAYVFSIRNTSLSQREERYAHTALYLFRAYMRKRLYEQRGKLPVGRPAKTKRNLQLFRLRESDPKKWSFDQLAKKYGFKHKKTAWDIYRNVKKYVDN